MKDTKNIKQGLVLQYRSQKVSKKHWFYSIGPKSDEKAMVLQYRPKQESVEKAVVLQYLLKNSFATTKYIALFNKL